MIYLNEEISWEEYFNYSFYIPKIESLSDEHKLEFDFTFHKDQLLENYNEYDMNFKIIFIDDPDVGKSYLYTLYSKSEEELTFMTGIF